MVASAETFRRRRRRRRLMLTSLLLAVITDAVVVVVDGQQPDSLGFISIDCGIPDGGGYSDESTRGLRYVPDAGFLDGGAGANAGINPPYTDRDLAARYLTVRYFPGAAAGERGGCYTLRRLSPGGRYLVRATFYYGDYDGAAATRLPVVFDLHVGVNRWTAVNVTAADAIYIFEAVVSPTADFLQVCLVNISLGTPLISGLDLRPLKAELYPEATANQSLLLLNQDRPPAKFAFNRYQFWRPASYYKLFRYKYDPYDRLWQPYGDDPSWTNITVAAAVDVTNITRSGDPSPILRSATTPANSSTRCLDFPWTSDSDADSLLLLYFAELQPAARRRFDVVVDGGVAVRRGYSPRYLAAEVVRATVKGGAAVAARRHVASLVASPDSTLPPLVNGLEIYTVQPMTELGTNDRDAKAMMAIRDKYELKKNWMGDPCAPKAFAWVGLNCTYASSVPAWITTLNLSSSVLTGPVDLPFGDLQSLQYLDLSNNSLSGPIPDFLAQMPSLKFLDLSSNNFSGLIPHNLLQKRQNGSLVLRIANNANLCDDDGNNACASENKQSKRILVIAIAVPIAVAILLFVAAILHLHRRLNNHETWMANNARLISPRERSNVFENRQFTYRELKLMTANFKEEIGQGGFGTVYLGYLEDGSPVAVKMCSKTSSQGDKEFIAEAQHLTRVHHRNLVSLIGYCKDKKHLALVYELEYLHKSCQPPLIHRDVKTRNILLTADLTAKLADFGLTKAFPFASAADGDVTHVTTQPASTLGYLDPEYYHTSRLSDKSDVHSFGVVLLELLTGRPPAVPVNDSGDGESVHVAVWVRRRLAEGDIEGVADPAMGEFYEVNSVWKVAELALWCKERPARERPDMAGVVAELRECIELEEASRMSRFHYYGYGTDDGSSSTVMTTTSSATTVAASDERIGELRKESFISIDCGIAENTTYSDDSTRGLRYVSDFGFVDAGAGLNSGINPPYNDPSMAARYLTVRYFPIGASHRGCYTLRSLTPGGKYLLRSSFYYGNYDGENILPAFDLHLNGHLWATINVTSAGRAYIHEVIVVAPAGYLQVCVVDRGLGTPFISVLDLRPLAAEMYPEADAGHSLALLSQFRPGVALGFNRYHFWPADYQFYRYPFDPYDRIWQRFGTDFSWTNITTSDTINTTNISGEVPSIILQSAATPATNVSRIDISWTNSGDPSSNNNITYLLLLYFAELQRLPANALRQFDILVDNVSWNGSRGYVPRYLNAEAVSMTVQGSVQQQQHSVSLVATANATLPPILNAFEVYMVQRMTEFQTNVGEAKAMMAIRDKFGLKKNWAGDPCTPEAFYWDGLNCSYSTTGPAWITALNMKSNGLTGPIDASFGDLKSLQYLDLSSNDFSGSIPIGLLQKQQNGSLTLRTHNNPNLCSNGASNCEPKNKGRKRLIIISIVVPIFIATSVFAIVMLLLRRMRNKQDTWTENNSRHNSPRDGSNILENYRQFTYKELKIITVNFKEEIGQGGFGTVFLGYMDNETPVAVKMSSKKSSQGDKEFLAEARYLSRVHHRNLVCLIGFCKDKSHLGLVYEYMQGGNLEDRLRGGAFLDSTLTWHQRLKIALDSAHGLEYLHKSCRPPLIHRDVKTKNILLSANLEAKISDFGLTKVFTDEFTTHITTQPAGTLGYLDPEYYNTSRLSEKTDVYSFGVVLLEIITAQPPAVPINDTESIHIAQWVRQKLSEGNIESIADPRMGGEYDINSVWKVAELALNCKEKPSRERPSMTDVVAELKEGLELEVSHALGYCSSVTTSTNNLSATSVDLKTDYDETSDPRQQSVVELGQAGNASETHVQGPTPR
uniref:non-specific serine/threonine protein kinase n=1 Tax=Leersia perrieri TaxID=77586 RepID=A0A0D9Y0J2_9ORYZ